MPIAFTRVTDPFPGIVGIEPTDMFVSATGDIFVARAGQIARTSDRGVTWNALNAGLPVMNIPSLGMNSLGELIAGVGTDGRGNGNFCDRAVRNEYTYVSELGIGLWTPPPHQLGSLSELIRHGQHSNRCRRGQPSLPP